jgi:hypothetical protein
MDKKNVRAAINELVEVSRKLNHETEDLNEIIDWVEKKIIVCKPGVSVWLNDNILSASEWGTIRPYDEAHYTKEGRDGWVIGFERIGGKPSSKYGTNQWRVVARNVNQCKDTNGYSICFKSDPVPLLQAPRGVRVEAIEFLPKLIEAINDKIGVFIKDVENAKARVKKLLETE